MTTTVRIPTMYSNSNSTPVREELIFLINMPNAYKNRIEPNLLKYKCYIND